MAEPTKQDYRDALDALELAVGALGIADLVNAWGEPRHRPELGVNLKTDCRTVYEVYDAYQTANVLMNR